MKRRNFYTAVRGIYLMAGMALAIMAGNLRAQTNYTPAAFSRWAGSPFFSGEVDATGFDARFDEANAIAVDSFENVFVADRNGQTVRKISTAGEVTTLAGKAFNPGSANGQGSDARFFYPRGLAIDAVGNLYLTDLSYAIRKITSEGLASTLAGTANTSGGTEGGAEARFQVPWGIAVDAVGNVFVGDAFRIRKVSPAGTVSAWAGTLGSPGSADGQWFEARFGQQIKGLAFDKQNNLYVSDSENHTIRKITTNAVVSTLAGSPGLAGHTDGIGAAARFNDPRGLAVDSEGNLLVADFGNFTIRKVTPAGVVTTVAGAPGVGGSADGAGPDARFGAPAAIAASASGNLFVADYNVVRASFVAVNSWTSSENGRWEDQTKWSLGTPSIEYSANYITNAGSKVVIIDRTTLFDWAESLEISDVVISAPENDINVLALFHLENSIAITAERIFIDQGGKLYLTNSFLAVSSELVVGFNQGSATLEIAGNARLQSKNAFIGYDDKGSNTVLVNKNVSSWVIDQSLTVGYESDHNNVLVDLFADLVNLGQTTVGDGRYENRIAITGYSFWRNVGPVVVGAQGGSGNNISADAGSKFYFEDTATIGESSDANFAVMKDYGSLWNNGFGLTVGGGNGNGNSLTIIDGAEVRVGTLDNGALKIGSGGDSNVVTVSSSSNLPSKLICNGPILMTGGGHSIFNALYIGSSSLVTTPSLVVSNGNFVGLAGGTLETKGTVINNGVVFPVGNGAQAATLHLDGGEHTFAAGLEVKAQGRVTGCGTIHGGVLVEAGGTILIDCGGPMTFAGDVTNRGTILTTNGSSVVFLGAVVNTGTITTNTGGAKPCFTVATGQITDLPENETFTISEGEDFVELNWSIARPGASGFVYATFNTDVAFATGVTNVEQIADASRFTFATNFFDSAGPAWDTANAGADQFVVLRNRSSGHYAVVRFDDVQDNASVDATWWFQKNGGANFSCEEGLPIEAVRDLALKRNGDKLVLAFSTQAGVRYMIESKTDLVSPTWALVTDFVAVGTVKEYEIEAPLQARKYFRVRAE